MKQDIDRRLVRVMAQVAVWVTIPVTVAALFNDWLARERAVRYRPGAPATRTHDPRTCPICSDGRGHLPIPPCGGGHDPRTCVACAKSRANSLRQAVELNGSERVVYPDTHPLKGHEDLFPDERPQRKSELAGDAP